MESTYSETMEKIVDAAEESRRLALDAKAIIWDAAVARCVSRGLSEHQPNFWDEVATEAGEPYRLASKAVADCYTAEIKSFLPIVRAARKAREQAVAHARYGSGYDSDVGSGYGTNSCD